MNNDEIEKFSKDSLSALQHSNSDCDICTQRLSSCKITWDDGNFQYYTHDILCEDAEVFTQAQ